MEVLRLYYNQKGSVFKLPVGLYRLWTSDNAQSVTSAIGTAFALFTVYKAALFVWTFIRPSRLQEYCHSQSGSWALVTGASDGIGRAFSEDLLSRGFNVLLHGRNQEKLQAIKDELSNRHPARSVEFVVANASKYDDNYKDVVEKVEGLPGKLTVLVNNVGGNNTRPQNVDHASIPHEDIDTCINLNSRFPTHLTRALLPILKGNAPALILNCGSTGGLLGVPYLTTYSAAKAYVHIFTSALKNEMVAEEIDNIEVMGCLIGNVSSAGNTHRMPFTTISSRECATNCLDRVGSSEALVWSSWKHALQFGFASLLPASQIRKYMAAEMRKRMEDERKTD